MPHESGLLTTVAARFVLAFVFGHMVFSHTGDQRPDHNAPWRFGNEHRERLRALFTTSVRVAREMKLVGLAEQALDRTKLLAACSGRGGFVRKHPDEPPAGLLRKPPARARAC